MGGGCDCISLHSHRNPRYKRVFETICHHIQSVSGNSRDFFLGHFLARTEKGSIIQKNFEKIADQNSHLKEVRLVLFQASNAIVSTIDVTSYASKRVYNHQTDKAYTNWPLTNTEAKPCQAGGNFTLAKRFA